MAQTIRELLDSREREVRRAIDDIKVKQLAPLERELTEIVIARSAIVKLPENGGAPLSTSGGDNARYMRMTYEELVKEALTKEFETGATIKELLTFIRDEYGREISQGSFSPVLSRMKAARTIMKMGKVWILPFDTGLDRFLEDDPRDPDLMLDQLREQEALNEIGEARASPNPVGDEAPTSSTDNQTLREFGL